MAEPLPQQIRTVWSKIARMTRSAMGADRLYLILYGDHGDAPLVVSEEAAPEPERLAAIPGGIQWLPRHPSLLAVDEISPALRIHFLGTGHRLLATAPLNLPEGVGGWVAAGFNVRPTDEGTVGGVMAELAETLVLTLYGSRQDGQVRQGYRVLSEIGMQIQAEIELSKVLDLVVRRAQELLRTEIAYILLVDEQIGGLKVTVSRGLSSELRSAVVAPGVGVVGRVYQQGRPIAVEDYRFHPHTTTPEIRSLVLLEQIGGIGAAPMSWEGRVNGVLVVANRRPTRFMPAEIDLLSALAAHASIAIQNARLYEAQRQSQSQMREMAAVLKDKVELLERSMSFQKHLTRVAISSRGVQEIAATTAQLIGRPVCIIQRPERPILSWAFPQAGALDDSVAEYLAREVARQVAGGEVEEGTLQQITFALPLPTEVSVVLIRLRGETAGCLFALLDGSPMLEVEQQALEHAAVVTALTLSREHAAFEAEVRLRGDLLDDLLNRRFENEEQVISRGARLGVELTRMRRCISFLCTPALPSAGGDIAAEIRTRALRVIANVLKPVTDLVMWRNGLVVALVPEDARRDSLVAMARSAQERLRAGKPSMVCTVGIGSEVAGVADLDRSYREAVEEVQLARTMEGPEAVLEYPKLLLFQLFLDLPDRSRTVALVRQQLGTLRSFDQRNGTDLLQTLRAYVEEEGELKAAAERIFMHVNSLKYRLERIGQVLNTDVRSPETRFQYRIAFRVMDFLTALGSSPWE